MLPRFRARLAALVLLVSLPSAALAGSVPAAGRGVASRSPVYARHGMVCAAQPLAVQAGLEILKHGGSAVDYLKARRRRRPRPNVST